MSTTLWLNAGYRGKQNLHSFSRQFVMTSFTQVSRHFHLLFGLTPADPVRSEWTLVENVRDLAITLRRGISFQPIDRRHCEQHRPCAGRVRVGGRGSPAGLRSETLLAIGVVFGLQVRDQRRVCTESCGDGADRARKKPAEHRLRVAAPRTGSLQPRAERHHPRCHEYCQNQSRPKLTEPAHTSSIHKKGCRCYEPVYRPFIASSSL